ncbi:MAG: DUF1573 domain-containing protein [Planctomycetes bacterium]|nr:DUF1573 domain-containing protein [Planctomycetota bacterium]
MRFAPAILTTVLALGSAAWSQAPAAAPSAAAASPVVIEPAEHDLGRIPPGSSQVRTFKLRNTGSAPVKIVSAIPSCKCTTLSDLAGKEIPAGGEIELQASLDAPRTPGMKDAKVFVNLEGGARPLVAKLHGDVTLPVQPSPPFVDALKGNRTGTIEFASTDGKPFRVLAVDGAAPQFADFDPTKDAPRSHYLVRWDFTMVPDGKFRQWMVVETDRADCALVPIRIRNESTGARFDPDVDRRGSFVPESIVVAGRMKPGEAKDLEIELESSAPRGKQQTPYWDRVLKAQCVAPEAHVQLLDSRRVGDRAMVRFRMTLSTKAQGFAYVPVTIETGTGVVRCFVAVVATP